MDICGYIYLYDKASNRQDVMSIVVYKCKNTSMIDTYIPSVEFVVDKKSNKIVSHNPNFSFISYSMLMEIVSTALELDKKTEYPSYAEFCIDTLNNPYLRLCNMSREIFPVPFNTDVFTEPKLYINITHKLTGSNISTVLKSSLYVHHLNYLALKEGILTDILFRSVCGRVFLNASCLCRSREGLKMIKCMFPDGAAGQLSKLFPRIAVKAGIKRYKISLGEIISNPEYTNPYHRIISKAVRNLPDNLLSLIDNPRLLNDIVNAEIDGFSSHFDNLVWQGVVNKLDDFDFVSVDDLLSISAFSYGRDMIKYHVVNNRKFFNFHKNKNIIAVRSNGELITSDNKT